MQKSLGFSISKRCVGVIFLDLVGRFAQSEHDSLFKFREAVKKLVGPYSGLRKRVYLVVNLEHVSWMDSSGYAELRSACTYLVCADGGLRLFKPQAQVRSLLERWPWSKELIKDNEQDAVRSFYC